MHRYWIFPALMLAIILTGCTKEDPEPVVEEPPPPTPEEIYNEIMSQTALNAPIPPKGTSLPPGTGPAFLQQIRGIQTRHKATEEGKIALKRVAQTVDERIPRMKDNELWDFVVVLCDVHELFKPGSTRFDRIRATAEIELRKPKVTVSGIFEADGRVTALLKFYLPLTGETFKEQPRIGEVLHGMKFIEVVGNNRGVKLEYLETGELINVMARG